MRFKRESQPLVWAHRGARSLAPENTLAAGQKAVAVGADGWEVDVRLTKDGQCVLFHDLGLLRTTDFRRRFGSWKLKAPLVTALTLAEIRSLDAGSWFNASDPFGQIRAGLVTQADLMSYRGEKVPTLGQALDFTRENNWMINIELKDMWNFGGLSIVDQAAADVARRDMIDQVLISSFNKNYLLRLQQVLPRVNTALLTARVPPDAAEQLAALKAKAIHPRFDGLGEPALARLRKRGYLVNVYTLNDAQLMKQFVSAGVDGIFTDFPHVLRTLLSAPEN
jgi:glycerophosphoryl diester phosphodiesterase